MVTLATLAAVVEEWPATINGCWSSLSYWLRRPITSLCQSNTFHSIIFTRHCQHHWLRQLAFTPLPCLAYVALMFAHTAMVSSGQSPSSYSCTSRITVTDINITTVNGINSPYAVISIIPRSPIRSLPQMVTGYLRLKNALRMASRRRFNEVSSVE